MFSNDSEIEIGKQFYLYWNCDYEYTCGTLVYTVVHFLLQYSSIIIPLSQDYTKKSDQEVEIPIVQWYGRKRFIRTEGARDTY